MPENPGRFRDAGSVNHPAPRCTYTVIDSKVEIVEKIAEKFFDAVH